MNRVTLCGRLVATPELQRSKNGNAVAHFQVRTHTRCQDTRTRITSDTNVLAFAQQAEECKRRLQQRDLVLLEGSLTTTEFQGVGGNTFQATYVALDRIQLLNRDARTKSTATSPKEASQAPRNGEDQDCSSYDAESHGLQPGQASEQARAAKQPIKSTTSPMEESNPDA